jgi:hypothetical protein
MLIRGGDVSPATSSLAVRVGLLLPVLRWLCGNATSKFSIIRQLTPAK